MPLGQIPGGDLRVYYHLENVNDSSSNGFNLTNNNSVSFNTGKFTKGADFGSSGTNKALTYGSNIFSTTTPDEVLFSFWFKLNSIVDTGNLNLFIASSKTSANNGREFRVRYSITSGQITISFGHIDSGGSIVSLSLSAFSASTSDWILIQARMSSGANTKVITAYNGNSMVVIATNSTTFPTSLGSTTTNPTVLLSIGNNRALTTQVFAIIDEFIVSETLYSVSGSSSSRVKYRTQSIGRF